MVGAFSDLGLVWDLADTCNGLIIIPNLIAIVIMFKEVTKIKDDFYGERLPVYQAEKAARKAK